MPDFPGEEGSTADFSLSFILVYGISDDVHQGHARVHGSALLLLHPGHP